MKSTVEKIYGSYRFKSANNLTDEHLKQLALIFNTPTRGVGTALGGRVSPTRTILKGIGPVIIKHYRRGGLLGHFLKRTYVNWGKTRCQLEFSQLKNARHLGISVPEPIAYAYKGHLLYRAWLITREIKQHQSLAQLSLIDSERTATARKHLLKQIVLLIENDIYHNDLHPGNVLIDNKNRIFIIDFDKASKYGKDRNKLYEKYVQRWNRAVKKHNLPEYLSLNNSTLQSISNHNA